MYAFTIATPGLSKNPIMSAKTTRVIMGEGGARVGVKDPTLDVTF